MPRKDPAVAFLIQYGSFFESVEGGDVIIHCWFSVFDPDAGAFFQIDATAQFNSLSLPGQIDSALVTSVVAQAAALGTTVARQDVYLPGLSRGTGA